MDLTDLRKPFKPSQVSWRVGSTNADKSKGMALCYIDARDVQDRLDEVCGAENWQSRYLPMHDKKTVCEIGIYSDLRNCWVWKSDGAGDSDVEAEKGALSDAFKRAAVRWGVGRYLYDLDSPWVALEPAGRSFKIAAHEYKRLEALLAKSAPAAAAVSPAPVEPTYEDDPDGQVKNWVDQQVGLIRAFKTLPELTAWLDKVASTNGESGDLAKPSSGSPLDRLRRKSPDNFAVVKAQYMQKLAMI